MVLGINADDVQSHRKFREKYQLPYRLLSDVDHAVCEAYGVWQEKSFMGKTFMGVVRTTYLVDGEGRVARVIEKVRPEGHGEEIAAALAEIG